MSVEITQMRTSLSILSARYTKMRTHLRFLRTSLSILSKQYAILLTQIEFIENLSLKPRPDKGAQSLKAELGDVYLHRQMAVLMTASLISFY
jgi:uncharacterized membrane protein YidH (DUF202 family)